MALPLTVGVSAPPHWWTGYFPLPSLPRTGCRQSPLGTGDHALRCGRRPWTKFFQYHLIMEPPGVGVEAGQKLAPRPPLRLLDGSLQGSPRFAVGLIQSSHRGFVLSPYTAGSGVKAPSTDSRLAETSDLLGPPVRRAGTARGSGPRHT